MDIPVVTATPAIDATTPAAAPSASVDAQAANISRLINEKWSNGRTKYVTSYFHKQNLQALAEKGYQVKLEEAMFPSTPAQLIYTICWS